jgi:hypothetical protein
VSERALRDQLEQHQAAIKALEAELAVVHAPAFLEQRAALRQALTTERKALDETKRALAAQLGAQAEAQRKVDVLDARGRSVNQRSLDVLPLVLVVLGLCVGSSFLRALEQQSVVGFGAAVLLGFTFGPRLLDWAVPGERRDPLAPSLTGAINDRARILGSLASVLMLLGGLVALVVNLAFWSAVATEGYWGASRVLQETWRFVSPWAAAALGSAALLSLRAGTRTRALLCLAGLGSIAVTAPPHLREALERLGRAAGYDRWGVLFDVSVVALPLLAFTPLAAAAWRGDAPRPWRLGLAAACAAVTLLLAHGVTQRPGDALDPSALTGVFGAGQLAGLALVAALSGDLSPWPRARLAVLVGALAALGVGAFLVLG